MKVELLAHTPIPETIVANSARLCYSGSNIEDLFKDYTDEQDSEMINKLAEFGHDSPSEHASFTFAIEGVSRSLTHQLVRHRMASYSQQSQRYVDIENFEYVVPPSVKKNFSTYQTFIDCMETIDSAYYKLTDMLLNEAFSDLVVKGVPEEKACKIAEKQALEDARYVLPNACSTKIIVTMNARSLKNFFEHRCCSRAQWEIRELADEMLKQVREVAPNLFSKAGASCTHGKCKEGSKSCGKPRK